MRVKNTFNAEDVRHKVKSAIGLYASTAALKLEGEAKSKAPWIDRTTNARNSIRGDFGWQGEKAVIKLSGNMDYSVYLELAMAKRYSILVPTIQGNAPSIMSGYQRLVK